MTVEDRVIELKLALEDDQVRRKEEKEEELELREKEISDLICYIDELQREYREGHKELIAPPPPLPPPPLSSVFESFFSSPAKRIISDSTESMRKSSPVPFLPTITSETPQMNMQRIVLDSTESTRESSPVSSSPTITPDSTKSTSLSLIIPETILQCTFTTEGKIICMNQSSSEEAQDALRRADNDQNINIFDEKPSGETTISDNPKKDTYIKSNEPVNNRGAFNQPPENKAEDELPASKALGNKKQDRDSYMTNNADACQPGLLAL
ncbi:hypothetical protein L211DRAFT_852716 [Terfezia boudieri ATCC MYA-4762]|uniref:Uncharacterized protein n=1 Tax=Terfezia boudieri ATCC MYA-4762 TaxID=1051890 RepID=A0A3N4LBF5_9PEZI|nr:hypothetical protein L211DRAFT_852716 [Terfezia boudieri ATCC MYA-4762]